MCILDIIIAIICEYYDKPFNTESNNVSKKRNEKDERNGTVSIPKTSEQERVPKQNYLNGNNKSMVFLDDVLGGTWVNMCSSAEAESSEYSGLKPKDEKSGNKWPNWNERPSEGSSHNWNKTPSESSSHKWNKERDD